MKYRSINLDEKFRPFKEHWRPKVVAEVNDYQLKIVKVEGDFVWHHHKDTDEAFMVIDGELRIDFRDGSVNIEALNTSRERVRSTRTGHYPVDGQPRELCTLRPKVDALSQSVRARRLFA